MDIYKEHFKMWLFDEERPVTCTFVANELGIHTNIAKQMLYQFSKDNASKVDATYLVSGFKNVATNDNASSRKSRSVVLVKEGRLNAVIEEKFDTVLSKHVYALSNKDNDDIDGKLNLISKKLATKLWHGDFQQRKNLLSDSGDLGQRFRANTGSSIKCESCNRYSDNGRTVQDDSVGPSSKFGSSKASKNKANNISSSNTENKKLNLKKSSVASFFGTKNNAGKKNTIAKQSSLFQKKKIAVASPPHATQKTKKTKVIVDDDDDDDDDDEDDTKNQQDTADSEANQRGKQNKMILEDDDDDDDDDDAGSTQVHVSNSPTVSITSSNQSSTVDNVSVANSMEVNTPLSPVKKMEDVDKDQKQTDSPTLSKPNDTDDSPTEEPPTMFSSTTTNKYDDGSQPKKKKYKKVLQNKTFQNAQGYFVTQSVYVDVTDDEAEDEDNSKTVPKKMMNLKRKSPSKFKKSNSLKSNNGGTSKKKKQKSLMGFFSKK
jgi:DNA polymerase delta subunit 3